MTMTNLKSGVVDTKVKTKQGLTTQLFQSGSMDGTLLKTMNKSKKLEMVERNQLKFEQSKKELEDQAWRT